MKRTSIGKATTATSKKKLAKVETEASVANVNKNKQMQGSSQSKKSSTVKFDKTKAGKKINSVPLSTSTRSTKRGNLDSNGPDLDARTEAEVTSSKANCKKTDNIVQQATFTEGNQNFL